MRICEWCNESGDIYCYREGNMEVEICAHCIAEHLRKHYPESPALKQLQVLYGENIGVKNNE